MTKKELERGVAGARGRSAREVHVVLEEFVQSIVRALSEGQSVTLRSFGRFEVRRRGQRRLRPPGSAREIRIPARLAPVFRSAPGLEKRLRAGAAGEVRPDSREVRRFC